MVLDEIKFNNEIVGPLDIELDYYYYDFKLFYYENNTSYFMVTQLDTKRFLLLE